MNQNPCDTCIFSIVCPQDRQNCTDSGWCGEYEAKEGDDDADTTVQL